MLCMLHSAVRERLYFICGPLKIQNTIRSDEGLALETSAFESLYGG